MEPPVTIDDLVATVERAVPTGRALDRLHAAVTLADRVNEVAEGLVGHFVEAARAEGGSWAQIGSELGVSKQAVQQRFVARQGAAVSARLRTLHLPLSPLGRGFFSRFTAESRQVITLAEVEAQKLGHGSVGTEHLLLSLLSDSGGRPVHALGRLGIEAEAVRRRVTELAGPGEAEGKESRPFTPSAKKAVELALREGIKSPGKQVAPGHILLGVLEEGEGTGGRALVDLGASVERVRQALAEPG